MIINDVQFNNSLEEIFDELQTQLAIKGIQYFQKPYRNSGDHIQVQCPYHGGGVERKASAGIRKSDGLFHCFACNEVHSFSEIISFVFGYADDTLGKEGWKWLLKNFATIQKEERKDIDLDYVRGKSKSIPNKMYISEKELDRYRYYNSYWDERGITDSYIIELFDLGYDFETNCITFPIRDEKGNCLFVARRSVKTKWFNYPKGVEKPLYGLYEIKKDLIDYYEYPKEVIVTESMLDALSFWQIGKYAVALNGTGNELQFKQLREMPCRKLILATDNDEAGKKARLNIRNNVKNKLITEYIFPKGKKDANECSVKQLQNLEEVF